MKEIRVGNITQVNSSYSMPQYQVTEQYTYDSADQLLTAESTCNNNLLCSGAYSYNNWGKINTYTQQTTDPATNTFENKDYRYYFPSSNADMAQGQTSFAPIIKYDMQQNPQPLETCTYGINGSIRKRLDHQTQNTDYYYFNASGNLKACGTDMQISVYGYNSANTRTYKVNMFNANQWVNGQPQPIQPMVQNAMFYPNTYLNFTQAGEYTKHYYNGTERIASRLGEQQIPISVENEQELEVYQHDVKQMIYNAIGQHLYDDPTDMQEGDLIPLEFLQPCGNNNAVFYYHPNHLSSTMYVTDAQQSVVQSFLYAPYGEIISEYNTHAMGEAFPKYSFNAKELDEETGMYYYEARYYAPPVFTSRDAMFEKYFWMFPYAYCANNPVKYVDPSGCMLDDYTAKLDGTIEKKVTNDNFDRFFVEKSDGQVELIAQLNKVKAADGSTTLVEFPDKGTGFTRYGEADIGGDHYVQPMVAAALFGAVYAIYSQDPTITIQFGDMSGAKGNKPGTAHTGGKYSHINGKNVDLRYVRIDRANKPVTVNDAEFDWTANQNVVNAFKLFGFSDILSYPTADGKKQLANTHKLANHHHHIHLQGFNKKPTIVQ